MKKILLIATGGTIASKYTKSGLSPGINAKELLSFVPEASEFCRIETVQPFNLDSTNICWVQWLQLTELIRDAYEQYDGFVICHGTDTMAYTAAALSYLIQNNQKPVVITGSQKPIDLAVTDARTNLLDSLRFAVDERAHGVSIVFGGMVIAGTRAKKERTKSYNAFSSINYPALATIQEKRIIFYIQDKEDIKGPVCFETKLNPRVFLYKLIPGSSARTLDKLFDQYDAVIIESFGVGGFPEYTKDSETESFADCICRLVNAGKIIIMATQVPHEGSDMSVYQVGQVMKSAYHLLESYDMTLEATVAKTMWILGKTGDPQKVRELFYRTINHDLLFSPDLQNP